MDDEGRAVILAVDANRRNLELLADVLGRHGYHVACAADMDELDAFLAQSPRIGLALVDPAGFGPELWDHCRGLSEDGVPVLLLARAGADEVTQRGVKVGARSVLRKPLRVPQLLSVVRAMLG